MGIDPIPMRASEARHTIGKLSRRATSLLQTLSQSKAGVRSYECPPKSRESKLGQFRDSTLGVPRQRAIRVWVRRSNIENTIWGKVVASPESGPWWIKWIRVAHDLSQHQECSECELTNLLVGFECRTK